MGSEPRVLPTLQPVTILGQNDKMVGGNPGLVVMGGDSSSDGRGFGSQHCILDEHFSHAYTICCKNYNVSLKRLKTSKKEARGWPNFKNVFKIYIFPKKLLKLVPEYVEIVL